MGIANEGRVKSPVVEKQRTVKYCEIFSKCLIDFACEAIWPWILFVRRFLIGVLISLLVIDLFKTIFYFFLIQSWEIVPF